MSEVRAYAFVDTPAAAPSRPSTTARQRAAPAVVVEVADAGMLAQVRASWSDLLTRTDAPNVFMDPDLVRVAAEADPKVKRRVLMAWKPHGAERQLVGVWAFAIRRARYSLLPIRVLAAPAYDHCYLASPVVDRDGVEETLDAMLDCIAHDPRLPNIIALDMAGADGPTNDALMRVLAQRGSAPCVFERSSRPKLATGLDGKAYLEKALSAQTRKKLRQHRRKLSDKGSLAFTIASEPDAVRRALEDFLAIEASGWKGRQGTALLNHKTDAAFMRGALAALTEAGCGAVYSLYLDARPISMQIVARCGAAAFTWKTTYDEAFRDFSPGMLLLEDYTAAFLEDKSIAFVDSCSFDDSGFMSAWVERQAVADLWIDARRGGSLEFLVLSGIQKYHRQARSMAKKLFLAWQKSKWMRLRKR